MGYTVKQIFHFRKISLLTLNDLNSGTCGIFGAVFGLVMSIIRKIHILSYQNGSSLLYSLFYSTDIFCRKTLVKILYIRISMCAKPCFRI